MREVIIASILQGFDKRSGLADKWSCSSSTILALAMALKFYRSVAKWVILKIKQLLGLFLPFREVGREILVDGKGFLPPPPSLS